jgi:tRNA threonylcarbamoyladenosine biosynthesis protein TsaB
MPTSAVHLLAFDTSTEALAVAVQSPSGAQLINAAGGALASATLLPHIHALLAQAGATLGQVQAIAFGRGPGAFTGLRTACAVAQGLGLGLNKPLLPIDSLLIVAEDARVQARTPANPQANPPANPQANTPDGPFEVTVAMDARMDEVYAGRYRWCDGHWQALSAPALYSLLGLAQAWAVDAAQAPSASGLQALAGSAIKAFGPRLPILSNGLAVLRFDSEHNRAAALLRLAVQAAQSGQGVDAADALPLYLRDKVAHTTAERELMRQQQAAAKAVAPAA